MGRGMLCKHFGEKIVNFCENVPVCLIQECYCPYCSSAHIVMKWSTKDPLDGYIIAAVNIMVEIALGPSVQGIQPKELVLCYYIRSYRDAASEAEYLRFALRQRMLVKHLAVVIMRNQVNNNQFGIKYFHCLSGGEITDGIINVVPYWCAREIGVQSPQLKQGIGYLHVIVGNAVLSVSHQRITIIKQFH
jgi:hypothetical protein